MFPKSSHDMSAEFTHGQAPDDVETVVGPSVVVEGDFASEGNILVKGTVSGNVKTARLLTVEPGAKILANVKAGDAVVAGEVRGNMKVDNKLELAASARVLGDVQCQVLVIAAGALVMGKMAMKGLEGEIMPEQNKKRTTKFKLHGDEEIAPGAEAVDSV